MAGHSKWANIKHRKAAQDAKRGKVFTKLIRELTVSARQGGGNPDDNPRLRTAVDKALSANMSRDTIDRAILRGAGDNENDNMEEVTYEGYGPSGVAVLAECLTDNKNRTVSEIRHAFTKQGGNLGTGGSVAYLFNRKGQIILAPGASEEIIMEIALEAGAEDIICHDDQSIEILTDWMNMIAVKTALKNENIEIASADVTMLAATETELDKDAAEKIIKLIDRLEDLDDVQNVYHNAAITMDIMDQISG